MRIGVLGTGGVGRTIATKLVELGHEVTMGSRTHDNESAAEWVASADAGAAQGTFADAAGFGELVVNCTSGAGSVEALRAIPREHLSGKTLVDVANPLDFSGGALSLFTEIDDSLAEQLQREHPEAHVVKTLNTVNANVMVEPARVPGAHDVFVCGNDEHAKAEVVELLEGFGWPREHVLDLGDLAAARGLEAYLLLWIRLRGLTGTSDFNIRVVR